MIGSKRGALVSGSVKSSSLVGKGYFNELD